MPIIDSGIRPRKPAAEKPLEPGAAKRARYGLGKAELRSARLGRPVTADDLNTGKA
jgi:hypothetical protein